MGFLLRLRFHGSIALVPNADKSVVTMLIGKFEKTEETKDLKPLVPHIKFHENSLQPNPKRKVRPRPTDARDDKTIRHIQLEDGELLRLNANVIDQPLKLNENDDPSPTPVKSTKFSLKWLGDIARLEDEETGTIDPELMKLPQDRHAPGRGVTGRIDLTNGLLQTTGILDPVLIDFVAPGRPRITTAIAREAELLLKVEDDSVVIESHSLFGEPRDTKKDMTFHANGADELLITIGNEPKDEIHQPIPTIKADDLNDKEIRQEFRNLYTLSKRKKIANPRLPQVRGRRPQTGLCIIPKYSSGG